MNDNVIRERLKKVAICEEVQQDLEELMKVVEEYETQIKSAITSDLTEKRGENLVKHYLQSMDITKINPTALKKICEEALNIGDIDVSFIPWSKLSQNAYRDTVDGKNFQTEEKEYLKVLDREIINDVFDENFNDLNLDEFLASIKKSEFMSDNRGIINDYIFYNYEDLEKFLKEEVFKIKLKPEVKESFEKMDKALDSSVASREIREYIKDTSKLDVLTYKTQGMISSKIYQELSKETLEYMIHELDLIEQKLKEVEQKALTYKNDYEKTIEIFEKRFRPKFTSKIANREEALLGFSLPTIEFYHVDNKTRSMDEQYISEVLSSGELSTLKIIQLIVECEAVKNSNPPIMIDDIVETFDYANRVATMEYLHDLSKHNARIILLTHNFDFFRFATSRLRFKDNNGCGKSFNKIYGYKTKNNNITLAKNKMEEFNLKGMLNIKDKKEFVEIIPLAREIVDIRRGSDSHDFVDANEDYRLLTYALHYDKNGKNMTVHEILNAIKRHIPISVSSLEEQHDSNYYKFILEKNFNIKDDMDLEGKIVYAVKIRIMLERHMLGYINNTKNKIYIDGISIQENDSKNYTRTIFDKNKHLFTKQGVEIAEKVLLTTPEYIYYNSFMYEPLIDVSKDDLIELHDQLTKLNTVYDLSISESL